MTASSVRRVLLRFTAHRHEPLGRGAQLSEGRKLIVRVAVAEEQHAEVDPGLLRWAAARSPLLAPQRR